MDKQAFNELWEGDRVAVNYLGERHEVTVIQSVHGDRWAETIVVRFDSGATWATKAEQVIERL